MLDRPFGLTQALWLVARRGIWNDAGTDAKHRRQSWLECPKTCQLMARSKRDPFGCHADTAEPLQRQWPGRFDGWPGWDPSSGTGGLHVCPNRVISDAPPMLHTILTLARDYRAGALRPGWREWYTAGVVAAIDYTINAADAAVAERMGG